MEGISELVSHCQSGNLKFYSQTILVISTKEQGLSFKILDGINDRILDILTLWTTIPNTLIEGLFIPRIGLLSISCIDASAYSQLFESSSFVITVNHSFHRIPHQGYVNGFIFVILCKVHPIGMRYI